MKLLIPFLCALLLATSALAEALPDDTFASSISSEGELQFDFSQLEPDNPLATPVAVDPIDKPTPTPAPTPNFWYDDFVSQEMGVSFNVPLTWLLNPNYDKATTLQFVEPQSEIMDENGYQTRITIEKVDMGLQQNANDALSRLQLSLEELGSRFSSFSPGQPAQATFAGCKGYYCYYRAEYNDGTKTYTMRGRIVTFAKDRSLYQVRLTAPSNWYSYYEYVYRNIRSSFKFI